MRNLPPGPGFDPAILFGILGAAIGLVLSGWFPSVSGIALVLGGFWVGFWVSQRISSFRKLRLPKSQARLPREHYHLPKEMRDGYYTDLVMKRIMQAYHPEGMGSEDDDQEEAEGADAEPDETEDVNDKDEPEDEFTWAGLDHDRTRK